MLLREEKSLDNHIIEEAARTIESITAEGGVVHQLTAHLLSCALRLIGRGVGKEDKSRLLLGHPVVVKSLRTAAEAEYRKAARFAQNADEKIFWIDLANQVRPRTLF